MFKRVEDDVLLGVSKVITNNNDIGNLLIDENNISSELKLSIEEEISRETSNDEVNEKQENEEVFVKDANSSQQTFPLTSSEDDKDGKSISKEFIYKDEYIQMKDELLSTLKENIAYLKDQIETKDRQLQNKDELIRNFQVLMKNDKDRIHELEAGYVEGDKVDVKPEFDGEIREPEDNIKLKDETKINIQANSIDTKKRGLLSWFRK